MVRDKPGKCSSMRTRLDRDISESTVIARRDISIETQWKHETQQEQKHRLHGKGETCNIRRFERYEFFTGRWDGGRENKLWRKPTVRVNTQSVRKHTWKYERPVKNCTSIFFLAGISWAVRFGLSSNSSSGPAGPPVVLGTCRLSSSNSVAR